MADYGKPRVKAIVLRVGSKVVHVDPYEARRLMKELADLFGDKFQPKG